MKGEVILKRLQEALKAKTYLLVLDDVWNEDVSKWEDFINSISGVTSTEGNGIIITTRSQRVASIVDPLEIYSLNGLSDADCWSIIKAKAFLENGEVPSRFERIGKKIAERCQGLPLAANVVGGLLRSKSEEEWRFINENWLSNDDEAQNITKILKLSFDHLSPPSLKKCFAYCSIFSKGAEMEKQKVIELWMAEGFLQLDERYKMESVGNKFFDVLLHNSLLIVAQRDIYGDVWSCVMHDLVHDLASSVLNGSHNVDGITPVRYIVHEEEGPVPKEVAKHLRTLFFKGITSVSMFSNFECLHNLSLTSSDCTELPNSIRELIHLRNLNISNTRIKNLPEWIGELYQLQTLRALCLATQKLPSTLKYLIKLRHLHIDSHVELPADMGRLTCLQTLVHFRVGKEKGYQIEELGSLRNLKGRLEIRNLERVRDKEEAIKANMFEKSNLSYLVFHWNEQREDESRSDESVLEGLQPHENANLKVLKIEGFKGKRFPTWTQKMAVWDGLQGSYVPLDKLFSITFRRCSECEEIPMLKHLPNLKSLILQRLKKVRVINCSTNHLTDLTISGLERMECLPDALFYNNRNLSNFMIYECPLLRELPDGVDTLNSLEQLYIRDCPNLKSIGNPSVQSQGILSTLRLWISGCGELKEFPCEMLESWAPSVEYLELRGLRSLNNLPELINCLSKSSPRLAEMTILGVPNFMASSPSVEGSGLDRLKELKIDVSVEWSEEKSVSIKHSVDVLLEGCCNSLTHLNLKGVHKWEWIPQSIQHLTALDWLRLENIGVEELPQWFWNLSSLTRLSLYSCNKLRHLPSVDALHPLTKLVWLEIKDCPELRIDPEWRNNVTVYVDGRSLAAA
ncbi:putative disease resistance protein RGA3 [Salvia splendens]|uniref:putative disease resistance protein RGA3 n=1 Tax=Salvia splendens TaxID=180675 RepID=UPI001C25ECEA|nr:putative disease resistance protein RGA3 [Salvia splendens]